MLLCISQFQLRPDPPPPGADPRALAFFCLGWQIPEGGTLEPGWRPKKMANAPSSVNAATLFIDRTVE